MSQPKRPRLAGAPRNPQYNVYVYGSRYDIEAFEDGRDFRREQEDEERAQYEAEIHDERHER